MGLDSPAYSSPAATPSQSVAAHSTTIETNTSHAAIIIITQPGTALSTTTNAITSPAATLSKTG